MIVHAPDVSLDMLGLALAERTPLCTGSTLRVGAPPYTSPSATARDHRFSCMHSALGEAANGLLSMRISSNGGDGALLLVVIAVCREPNHSTG
jgi:hypothetical protein